MSSELLNRLGSTGKFLAIALAFFPLNALAARWDVCPNNPALLYSQNDVQGISYWLIPIGKKNGDIDMNKSLDKIGNNPNYIGVGDVFCDYASEPVKCTGKNGKYIAYQGNYLPRFPSKDGAEWEYSVSNTSWRGPVKIICPTPDLNVQILFRQQLSKLKAKRDGQVTDTGYLVFQSEIYGLDIKQRQRFVGF
jgi:hypothetical protein